MSLSKPMLNIVTDSTGFFKLVTFNGKALTHVTDATIYLNAKEPAQVEITVQPVVVEVSAEVCSVAMKCPVCEFYQTHQCNVEQDDNRTG